MEKLPLRSLRLSLKNRNESYGISTRKLIWKVTDYVLKIYKRPLDSQVSSFLSGDRKCQPVVGIHVHENELVAFIKHIDADNDGQI